MKINGKIKIAIAVLLVAGCAFGGYKYYTAQQEAKKAAAIETTDVVRMDLTSTVSATGTIRPVDYVDVSPKSTGRITKVLVKENESVKAGQTVATLDSESLKNTRDQAQYKVTDTKAKYERAAYLYSIGAKAQTDLETAEYDYDTAKSALEKSEADLAETVITAPMDGVVVGQTLTVGSMAVQGNSSPTVIMRIADLSKKQIMAKVDETDIGNIKIGQDATFTVDAFTGKSFTAHVSKISQTDVSNTWETTSSSSSSSSTSSSSASVIYYYVTLDVDDPDGVLLPAMTARVEINTSNKSNALAIPISALKTDANGSYVVLAHADGTTENHPVTTGIYSDEYVEILDGVDEGDKLSITYKAAAATTNKSSGGGHPGGPGM